MLASPPILQDDDPPPLFNPLIGHQEQEQSAAAFDRPSALPIQGAASDDSILTVSSNTTSTTSTDFTDDELAMSLGKIVVVDSIKDDDENARHHDNNTTSLDLPDTMEGMYSIQSTLTSDHKLHQSKDLPPSTASLQPQPQSQSATIKSATSTSEDSSTSWRRQALPALITDSERALRNIRTSAPSAILGTSCSPLINSTAATTTLSSAATGAETSFSPSTTSSPIASTSSTTLDAEQSKQSMSSSLPSLHQHRLPSPTSARPGSSGSGNFSSSTSSSRPWVRDSDASSVCSAASSCWSSSNGQSAGDEAEVYKPVDGTLEFLDPRPEPEGVRLTIHRDDPHHVVIKVILPGFSLENITVAMRRGHKLHIVADSYGTGGGHFEKLISLGTDVSSAAPRAEFNGSELNVYIRRKRGMSTSTPPPMSPPLSIGSPTSSLSSAASPRPDSYFDPYDDESPVVTRSTADNSDSSSLRKSGKSLTGPEGARAAAKAAREEASRRAKEAAKSLPSCGSCKFPFKRGSVSSVTSGSSRSSSVDETNASSSLPNEPLSIPPGRSGTIKARTPSPSGITNLVNAFSSEPPTQITPQPTANSASDSTTTPSRPKFRSSNLTLKATDKTSFLDAVLRSGNLDSSSTSTLDSWPSPGSQEGSTPRVERTGMDFNTNNVTLSPRSTPVPLSPSSSRERSFV